MKGYLYALNSALLSSVAQLLMKWGMVRFPKVSLLELNLSFFIENLNLSIAIMLGLLAYMIAMLSWFFALCYLPLHQVYPLVGISYALVYLGAIFLPDFNETTSLMKTLGVSLIFLGLWIMVMPHKTQQHP